MISVEDSDCEIVQDGLGIKVESVRANFYKQFEGKLTANCGNFGAPAVPYEQLNNKQRTIVDLVRQFLEIPVDEMASKQLLLFVQGAAGKS